MIDIDNFKYINDTYGHLAGDKVLRTIANIIKNELRSIDIIARYGGDEFIVLIPKVTSEYAMFVAERIRAKLEGERILLKDTNTELQITLSIGVACCPENGQEAEDLIANADTGLYRSKKSGRNKTSLAI